MLIHKGNSNHIQCCEFEKYNELIYIRTHDTGFSLYTNNTTKQDQNLSILDFLVFFFGKFQTDGREIEQESPLLRTKCLQGWKLSRREQLPSPLEVLLLKKGFYFPAFCPLFCLFFNILHLFFSLHSSASDSLCCLPNSMLINHYENGR